MKKPFALPMMILSLAMMVACGKITPSVTETPEQLSPMVTQEATFTPMAEELATAVPPTPTADDTADETADAVTTTADYKNVTIFVDGVPVTLVDGISEVEMEPGSSIKVVTRFEGCASSGDLTGDDLPDMAYVVSQTSGGSGVFYYLVVAWRTVNGYTGSNALLLGDRIIPYSSYIENGVLKMNYADRKPGEAFTEPPSVNVTRYFHVENGLLLENPSTTSLTRRTWTWTRTQLNDGTLVTPIKPGVFTLTLADDGTLYGTTDCNNFFGSFTLQESALSFADLTATRMYCEGSQETIFMNDLMEVQSYLIMENQLVLELMYDSGQMIFE